MPASTANEITENDNALKSDIKVVATENGYVIFNVGSGVYHFAAAIPASAAIEINTAEYVGKYKTEGGMVNMIEIVTENEKLVAKVFNNSGELEPVKDVKDQFSSADGSTVTFIRDTQNNKIVKIKMDALGMTFEGTKQ